MSEIDVSECRYYSCDECFAEPETDYCGEIHSYNKCGKYEDCYYKQLEQLKIENEELKKTINKLGIEHENYDNLIYWQMKEQQDKLKAENEELKNKNNSIHSIADDLQQRNHNLTLENEEMYKLGCENYVAIEQAKRLYKLNKCLDEIEECIKCCATTLYGCGNCKKGDECDGALSDLILQKIKEVKE